MNHQLTTIAAIPGSGVGCAAALKPEVHEARRVPWQANNGVVKINVGISTLKLDAQTLIANQLAESTRRTLLRIAGATA